MKIAATTIALALNSASGAFLTRGEKPHQVPSYSKRRGKTRGGDRKRGGHFSFTSPRFIREVRGI